MTKGKTSFENIFSVFRQIAKIFCADILGGPCLCTFCSIFLDLTTGKAARPRKIINNPLSTFIFSYNLKKQLKLCSLVSSKHKGNGVF